MLMSWCGRSSTERGKRQQMQREIRLVPAHWAFAGGYMVGSLKGNFSGKICHIWAILPANSNCSKVTTMIKMWSSSVSSHTMFSTGVLQSKGNAFCINTNPVNPFSRPPLPTLQLCQQHWMGKLPAIPYYANRWHVFGIPPITPPSTSPSILGDLFRSYILPMGKNPNEWVFCYAAAQRGQGCHQKKRRGGRCACQAE